MNSIAKPSREDMLLRLNLRASGLVMRLLGRATMGVDLDCGQHAYYDALIEAGYDFSSSWEDSGWGSAFPIHEIERLYLKSCPCLPTQEEFDRSIVGFSEAVLQNTRALWARRQFQAIEAAEGFVAEHRLIDLWLKNGRVPLPEGGRLAWVQSLSPDDWHIFCDHWNWDNGLKELDFIVSQRNCDLATAATIFYLAEPGHWIDFETREHVPIHGLASYDLARKIAVNASSGYYTKNELSANIEPLWVISMYRQALDKARDCNRLDPTWELSPGFFGPFEGREAKSDYCAMDGVPMYSFEYFKTKIHTLSRD